MCRSTAGSGGGVCVCKLVTAVLCGAIVYICRFALCVFVQCMVLFQTAGANRWQP